jgi:ABC-type Mn2+/Zn2+ transport system ATPase subunit
MKDVSVRFRSGSQSAAKIGHKGDAGGKLALANISFHVNAGHMLAVVGPNGAGKSTLFKLVVGTLRPSSGSIEVYGHRPDRHTCISYVPQRNQFDYSFPVTVWDVVMMGRVAKIGLFRRPSKHDRDMVRHCLERVAASNLAGRQIGELSGGQQQRIFIARALAQEAELIMLDEPLNGLDGPSRESILAILEALSREGVAVLVATHDISLAVRRFHRAMLLNGRIVAIGAPDSVLQAENLLLAYGGQDMVAKQGVDSWY